MNKNVVFFVADTYTKLVQGSYEAKQIVKNVCRARPKGYQWMPKYRRGRWDGYISLLKYASKYVMIPTGLMEYVPNELKDCGWDIKYVHNPNRPISIPMPNRRHIDEQEGFEIQECSGCT